MKSFFIFIASAFLILVTNSFHTKEVEATAWIRINLLGYKPTGVKVAVWCSKERQLIRSFQLVDSAANKIVLTKSAGKAFGAYGPFLQSFRLDFSSFNKPGRYYLKAGTAISPVFAINSE